MEDADVVTDKNSPSVEDVTKLVTKFRDDCALVICKRTEEQLKSRGVAWFSMCMWS